MYSEYEVFSSLPIRFAGDRCSTHSRSRPSKAEPEGLVAGNWAKRSNYVENLFFMYRDVFRTENKEAPVYNPDGCGRRKTNHFRHFLGLRGSYVG